MTNQKKSKDVLLKPNRYDKHNRSSQELGEGLPFARTGKALVPTNFGQLSRMGKVNAILDLEKPEEFVQSLPVQELHQLIHHIGLEDAAVIVPMVNQEQFQCLLDLDLWIGFDYQPERLERWLWAFEEYGDLDELASRLSKIDDELLIGALMRWAKIHLREDKNEDPVLPDDAIVFSTPDQRYFVEIFGEDAEEHFSVIHRLIDCMYRDNLEESLLLLDRVSSELPSEIEEGMLRFRNARMEDLGFVPFDLSVGIVAYLDPAETKSKIHHYLDQDQDYSEHEMRRVGTALMPAHGTENFLTKVLGLIEDPKQQDQFVLAFSHLCNRSSVVHFVDLTDLERLGQLSREIYCTLNVGLEYLSEGNLDLGRKILTRMHTQELHRVGHSLPVQATRIARSALKVIGGDHSAQIFDAPLDDFLSALVKKTPRFAESILGTGSVEQRFFRTLTEVQHAGHLATAARLVCLFFAERFNLNIDANPDDPDVENLWSDVRLSSLWLTLLVRRATDEPVGLKPVKMSAAQYWSAKICADGPSQTRQRVLEQTDALLSGLGLEEQETRAALGAMVAGPTARRVFEELAHVQERPFNPLVMSDLFLLLDDEPGASAKIH